MIVVKKLIALLIVAGLLTVAAGCPGPSTTKSGSPTSPGGTTSGPTNK
jgi:hypothetical protein